MRKLILIAATALAATALSTTAAQAQTVLVGVFDDPAGNYCGEVVVDGNDATGGCLIQASGSVQGYFTNPVWHDNCQTSDLDLRVSGTGDVYAANPVVSGVPCGLKACEDESLDEVEMWTGQLTPLGEPEDGIVTLNLDACVESNGYGGAGTHYPIELSGQLASGLGRGQTDITTTGTLAYPSSTWSGNWTSDDEILALEVAE